MGHVVDMADQRLYHLDILVLALSRILENNGTVCFPRNNLRQFVGFKCAVHNMTGIIRNLLQKGDITVDDRKECVKAINLTIEKMDSEMSYSDMKYIQDMFIEIECFYRPGVLSHRSF